METDQAGSGNHWYVVHCKAGRESYARLLLETLGVVTYLPLLKKYRQRIPHYIPLFPGYIFIYANLRDVSVSSINYCMCVLRILGFGNGPVVLDGDVVEAISNELDRLNNLSDGYHDFRPDELLRIKNGPLQGMEAVFIGPTTPSLRVRVFLNFLGGLKEAQVDVDALERVPGGVRARKEASRKKERYTRGKGRKIKGIA